MVRPIKKKQIPNLQEAIKETAWKQIAEFGAPALSLRAIARELKITAPAIYNYFPDRDALVTALIIDAYTSFGDWQIEASESTPKNDFAKQLQAIGIAYRDWANEHPQRYQLIFGTPIPGYEPPAEKIFPSSARSISALFHAVENIRAVGKLNISSVPTARDESKDHYKIWENYFSDVHPNSIYVAMLIWARVHGVVSLEIQGNLPFYGKKGDALYLFELESNASQFIKE
ncbi:MAG: putative HTH-type transcriptional regulator [Anaerolineales bacterium]|nr:putative HTH-type transcriptional regulator [Anaerolineales bacterium]